MHYWPSRVGRRKSSDSPKSDNRGKDNSDKAPIAAVTTQEEEVAEASSNSSTAVPTPKEEGAEEAAAEEEEEEVTEDLQVNTCTAEDAPNKRTRVRGDTQIPQDAATPRGLHPP